MSSAEDAAPAVPLRNSGVARRFASGPNVLTKRDTLVGKIEDVPSPAIEAPTESITMLEAAMVMEIPASNTNKLRNKTRFSFKNLK